MEEVGLPYHLRNIITRVLISYLSFLADSPELIRELDPAKKKMVSVFAHTYLGDMTGQKLQEVLLSLKSVPQRVRDFWSKSVGFLEPVINLLLKRYGIDPIDLPNLKQEEKILTSTYK